jgi:hypothetical protein
MMAPTNYEQTFEKSLPLTSKTMVTVTSVPEKHDELLKLLERAMLRGFANHGRLTEIHLPMARFPSMDSKFWHVPIEDCGNVQVLRFFFETHDALAQ